MKLTFQQAINQGLIPDLERAGASQLLFFAGEKTGCKNAFKHLRLHSWEERVTGGRDDVRRACLAAAYSALRLPFRDLVTRVSEQSRLGQNTSECACPG